MEPMKPPYKVRMWVRVLAAIVVLLSCVAVVNDVLVGLHENHWPLTLGKVPDLVLSAGLLTLFAWVAATGRVPRWTSRWLAQGMNRKRASARRSR